MDWQRQVQSPRVSQGLARAVLGLVIFAQVAHAAPHGPPASPAERDPGASSAQRIQAGNALLALVTEDTCISAGTEVRVLVSLSAATTPIVAGQFFLTYDNVVLEFVAIQPGDVPFTMELSRAINEVAGTIDYAVSVPVGSSGTMEDATMAVADFTAIRDVCAPTDLVAFRAHDPPTRLSDAFGGAIEPALADLTIQQQAPQFVLFTINAGSVDQGCELQGSIDAFIVDDCCISANGVTVNVRIVDDNADLSTNLTISQVDVSTVHVGGSVTVSGLTSCPATLEVTIDASDCCGLAAAQEVRTGDVVDTSAPQLTCPDDLVVTPPPGACAAEVLFDLPVALDNCDAAPVVMCSESSGDTLPSGTTPVTCEATDACGNEAACAFDVTVREFNDLLAEVQYGGVLAAGPISRCVRFEFWNCGVTDQTPLAVVDEVLEFYGGWTLASVDVPCGEFTCVTARDDLHTLRRTVDPIDIDVPNGTYAASFVGVTDTDLIGGNLDSWNPTGHSDVIDILDFGVFMSRWGTIYGTGDTPCGTAAPHADINGDGLVDSIEFSFIQINFLKEQAPNCCGAPGVTAACASPVTRISVKELLRTGRAELTIADLNHDGWVDMDDIAAFAQGVRPEPAPKRATHATDRVPASRLRSIRSDQ